MSNPSSRTQEQTPSSTHKLAAPLPRVTPDRLDYVDTTKGIGIILVVFGHMLINHQDRISDRLFDFIYLFHMPLFFAVSGYLFKPEKYDSLVKLAKARTASLLLPYLIFTFFSVALFLPQAHRVTPIMMDIIMARRQQMPFNEALWFLPALFIVEIGFYVARKALRLPTLIIISAIAISYLGYPHTSKPQLFWSADAAAYYVLFYCVGFHLARINLSKIPKSVWTAIFVSAALLLTAGFLVSEKIPDYYHVISMYYPHRFLLFSGIAIAGSIATVGLGVLLSNYKPLASVGRNSLLILGLHIPIRFLVIEPLVIRAQLEIPVQQNNLGLFYFTVVCIVLVPTVHLFKKIMTNLR